jgi:hypothetical protein
MEIVDVGLIGDDERGGYNLLSQRQQAGGHTIFGKVERLALATSKTSVSSVP